MPKQIWIDSIQTFTQHPYCTTFPICCGKCLTVLKQDEHWPTSFNICQTIVGAYLDTIQLDKRNTFYVDLSLRWLNSLLSLGAKRPLQAEDLYGLLEREQTDTLTETLERYSVACHTANNRVVLIPMVMYHTSASLQSTLRWADTEPVSTVCLRVSAFERSPGCTCW